MDRRLGICFTLAMWAALTTAGCQSPYRADQGALLGGLGGAGVGALIGNAVGNTGAGAAIGAGVGALSGAAIGGELDEIEARNRAMIAQQLGRQVAQGAVTMDDVVAMTRGGVHEDLIVNHIRYHGVAAPLQASDLISLQQQGVSTRVIAAMQSPPMRPAPAPVVVEGPPPPVIVQEYHYDPFWGPPRPWHHHGWRYHRPGVSWGMTFHN